MIFKCVNTCRSAGGQRWLFLAIAALLSAQLFFSAAFAAARQPQFAGIEEIWQTQDSPGNTRVAAVALSLLSSARLPDRRRLRFLDKLGPGLLYLSRVRVGDRLFYRLIFGDYADRKIAEKDLQRLREWFPGAWIVQRTRKERDELTRMLSTGRHTGKPLETQVSGMVTLPRSASGGDPKLAGKLLEQARQKLIDKNYARVLRITDKVIEIGNDDQRQSAMELAGIARERQRNFAQAIRIYREFLTLYPNSRQVSRIRSRLQGLLTMREEPRKKLEDKKATDQSPWDYFGTFSQYYRHDTLDQQGQNAQNTGSLLSTDLDVTVRRKKGDDSLQFRFNGGLINDFTDKTNEGRLSRAEVRFQDGIADFEVIGGRQSRTINGYSGRFDGVVFTQYDPQRFDYSLFAGSPVQTSASGFDSERWFAGGGMSFRPLKGLSLDWYAYVQQISGLTDRQVTGVEWQYRPQHGFLFGSLEYDFYFDEIDHFSVVANYRTRNKWVLNLNWDYRYSPVLATLNALQGQTATTLNELKNGFTADQIHQLAQDRTARNQTLFVGASYSIDLNRLVSLNLSSSHTDATVASGGVDASPESTELQFSADYSFKGWFMNDDFATWGLRLSDSDTASVVSVQARSRLPALHSIFYTPRLRLDHRSNKSDNAKQWILAPEIKLSYRYSRKMSLEGSFGFEYSNFNLPELNDQIAYSLYLSYFYQF